MGKAATHWPTLSYDAQRSVIAAVIDTIEVGPGKPGSNIYDPARLTVNWIA